MGSLLRLLTLQVLSPVLRPLIRLIVGFIAIPVFRLFVRRVVRLDRLDAELTKDLEQWVRGSLVLLVATANIEYDLIGQFLEQAQSRRLDWLSLGLRLLVAVGVIEAMPDQALFSIIHPGPEKLLFPKGRRLKSVREQWWPLCRGLLCRHLDRSSSVFAILSVIFGGDADRSVGWVCYLLAIAQFLIIGLVSSRDKALDVLSEFDQAVHRRREELAGRQRVDPADRAAPPDSLADLVAPAASGEVPSRPPISPQSDSNAGIAAKSNSPQGDTI
ncbi:MAG: DNA topoisomerase I [Planctomycetaceae bacterium]|nr:DNA topoisomerase I [Planctomycetaceae bacterium]